MFDSSFSISKGFSQDTICQKACILNQKCSRRNEKSKKHVTLTLNIMKNEKNHEKLKISKLIETINVSFSISNTIDFCSETFMWLKFIVISSKFETKFLKISKNDKNEQI